MSRAAPKPDSPRLLAARLVHAVAEQGESLNRLAADAIPLSDPRERGLTQELAFGTLRWYFRLDAILSRLLARPLKPRDRDLQALILVGLYQLLVLETPAHAAVSETVDAARSLGKEWAAGLVNAVLRNAVRRRRELLALADGDPVARWSHPRWWIDRLRQDWPDDWAEVLEADNRRPPMSLRVNLRRTDRQAYIDRLTAAGLEARALPWSETAVELATPVGVDSLPGFAAGEVSVQDGAAQLCAPLLDLRDGQRVLDACAAPGGKTGHILESAARLAAVVAVDNSRQRLQKVTDNLRRLQLAADCLCADAAEPQSWWDGRPFERILLDAPCSASGVIRRHPDIRLLRRPDDLTDLAVRQQRLLAALWPLLATGGMLLYVTCSVFKQENIEVVQRFVDSHADACLMPLDLPWGRALSGARQLLPGEQGMDGFFFARLTKA